MNFNIHNKPEYRRTDFELLGRDRSAGEACKVLFKPSTPESATKQKKIVLGCIWMFYTMTPNRRVLLGCSVMYLLPFGASLASFIQQHKAGIGIQNLAKNIAEMQVVLLGSLKKADMYVMLYFSALSRRAHNVQQFEISEITTLKPFFDWFLQNTNVTSKQSDEDKEKLCKLGETTHREFLHLITPICRD